MFIGYRTCLFKDNIGATFQINGRNLQEGGQLQAVNAFPHGRPYLLPILDEGRFIFTATFDLQVHAPGPVKLYLQLRQFLAGLAAISGAWAADRPNILWLTSEDHGPQMGCYGDPVARTPHVDGLAAKGMLFKRAWSNAPVCAAARTTLIAGMFAPSLGAEHMRSEVAMPAGAQMYPQYLRAAGYYCTNHIKEDYNLTQPGKVWDESSNSAHWRKRAAGQPFFAIFNANGSHEIQVIRRPHQAITDPARVRVPAYHPDTPEVRRDWAQYYDQVSVVDAAAGQRLGELADAGLADDTVVFYFADHGPGMPRNKRWPSDSGLRVPMVVYFPPKWRHLAPKEYAPGSKSDRLVSFVDLAPTLLSLVGLQAPATMQGHAFAGPFQTAPQPFIHGYRGRMDERYDLVRSVTDGRFVYLRNYMPHRSQAQHVNTQFETPTTQVWRRLFEEGKTNDAQSVFWREPKAPEELYDLQADPDETRNLASSTEHRAVLAILRQAQKAHAVRIRDTGFLAEAEVHARSGAKAPRDALATDAAYPFARVFAAADVATMLEPGAVPQLLQYLKDGDRGVRYWGAMGALMRGRPAVDTLKRELAAALNDGSPSVRIAAAEALARFGDADDLTRALATLRICADPTRTSAYAGIAAMNAIDELGAKASPIWNDIRTMPTNDPGATARGNGYVLRLQNYIAGKEQLATQTGAAATAAGQPLFRAIDLDIAEAGRLVLADGTTATLTVLAVNEEVDDVRGAIRRAEVRVRVNGEEITLACGSYNLPVMVAGVQIDCPITQGYNARTERLMWGLDKAVRLRLWPAGSLWMPPGTFEYPARQRWFATNTQMANEPSFVDGGEKPDFQRRIYYHWGLDIGGSEGLVEVVAATDGIVVSLGTDVLAGERGSPAEPRYDVLYLRDSRNWYYRYSHLKSFVPELKLGQTVRKGQRVGWLGKEGGSGGWSHLHFDITSRQPSGKWGILDGYAFFWEAYHQKHPLSIVAVARPHHLAWVDQAVTLDGRHSRSASGRIVSYEWSFTDGGTATGATVEHRYQRAGVYSEILKVTDAEGRVDYDFAPVQILDKASPETQPATINANFSPTFGIKPGDPVTFKVRSFRTYAATRPWEGEIWNFGDGSPLQSVKSDGNFRPHAPVGYAETVHRFGKPGVYLVSVERAGKDVPRAVTRLKVVVE